MKLDVMGFCKFCLELVQHRRSFQRTTQFLTLLRSAPYTECILGLVPRKQQESFTPYETPKLLI